MDKRKLAQAEGLDPLICPLRGIRQGLGALGLQCWSTYTYRNGTPVASVIGRAYLLKATACQVYNMDTKKALELLTSKNLKFVGESDKGAVTRAVM